MYTNFGTQFNPAPNENFMYNIKKIILACLFLQVFLHIDLYSQKPAQVIEQYGDKFPQEKIHIHFDRTAYMPGETIWFKAYLFEENLPTSRSTNFYAALYDDQGKLVQQQISPIFNGTSDGHFIIPDSLRSTKIICRAYTGWMLNFDTALLYTQIIRMISSNTEVAKTAGSASLHFFPEGGNIVEGAVNTIAFKANYDNGLPYAVDGVIKKQETGEVIMPLTAIHDGMGRFDLDFQSGAKYYAEWLDNNGAKQQTFLPAANPGGISLKLIVQKDKLFYNLVNKTGNDSLHVLMYMYQKVFYKTSIKVSATEPFTAVVPVNALPTGTMQLTVFDANWQPVAERVAFINNNNFSINAAVDVKQVSTQKRGKNLIEIFVADSIAANMSLSISDADMNADAAEHTIVSNFLLKGDIKGYIHDPAFYFSNNNDAALKAKLDLVMLTNGWRRYNWANMKQGKMPAITVAADEYLQVYGQVGAAALDKMDKEETINLIVKTKDSTTSFYAVKPTKAGVIKQSNLLFYDSARVYFTFNKSKLLNKQAAFSNSNFTITQSPVLPGHTNYFLRDTGGTAQRNNASLFAYYKGKDGVSFFNTEKTMQGVVVKTSGRRNWQNDPKLKMEERYVSGIFTAGALGYTYDVLHDERAWTKRDVYAYITNAIPGLSIGNFNLAEGRAITYQQKPVLIYIDEREMTASELETLSLTQVAFIKFIPNFIGRGAQDGSGGMSPALSVYTRKGDDLIDRTPKETDINMVKVAGYSPLKEFYSPDYSQSNTGIGADARITLLWMPYVLTDRNSRKIPVTFYNNDLTKRIRIVLEGINEDGKMIHIEKIIQ